MIFTRNIYMIGCCIRKKHLYDRRLYSQVFKWLDLGSLSIGKYDNVWRICRIVYLCRFTRCFSLFIMELNWKPQCKVWFLILLLFKLFIYVSSNKTPHFSPIRKKIIRYYSEKRNTILSMTSSSTELLYALY